MERPDFWQDNQNAQKVSKEEAALTKRIQPWLELRKAAAELAELAAMDDESMRKDIDRRSSQDSAADSRS